MTHLPIEVSQARQALDTAWAEYMNAVDAGEPKEIINEHYQVTQILTERHSYLYNEWQTLGGTSAIDSITYFLTDAEIQEADAADWNMQVNELRGGL